MLSAVKLNQHVFGNVRIYNRITAGKMVPKPGFEPGQAHAH